MMTREERSEYRRARYAANPERERELNKAWKASNHDRIRVTERARYAADSDRRAARVRAWRAARPEIAGVASKTWRQANPAVVSAYRKMWKAANPEKTAAYIVAWQKANPNRVRANKGNQRARNRLAFVESIDPNAVFVRDGGVCQICDTFIGDAKWHLDHRIPLARSGEHSYVNVQLAHAKCNMSKGARV